MGRLEQAELELEAQPFAPFSAADHERAGRAIRAQGDRLSGRVDLDRDTQTGSRSVFLGVPRADEVGGNRAPFSGRTTTRFCSLSQGDAEGSDV